MRRARKKLCDSVVDEAVNAFVEQVVPVTQVPIVGETVRKRLLRWRLVMLATLVGWARRRRSAMLVVLARLIG